MRIWRMCRWRNGEHGLVLEKEIDGGVAERAGSRRAWDGSGLDA